MAERDPYRRIAGVYDRLIGPTLTGVRLTALRLLPPQPEWRVLDVGCGTGAGLEGYIEAGCAATGVDVSPAMLAKAEVRLGGRAELRLSGGGRLPFDDGHFDLVATSMVLHEVPAGDRGRLVSEMARVAGRDGQLLITDFRFGDLRWWRGPVMRAFTIVVERISGHWSGYRSFKTARGVPPLLEECGLRLEREKIVSGGNLAVYVASTS